jgi:hypothetical protein
MLGNAIKHFEFAQDGVFGGEGFEPLTYSVYRGSLLAGQILTFTYKTIKVNRFTASSIIYHIPIPLYTGSLWHKISIH